MDAKGGVLPNAAITIKNESTGLVLTTKADAQGRFFESGLPAGRYTIEASALGFNATRRTGVQLSAGQPQDLPIQLNVGDSQQVTVNANAAGSIAAALAPMDASLEAISARTYISPAFIQNFTSPVADYGEAVAMAPGTFTTNGNGVGLGQSSTYFRGFPDGNYDIDFDGVPFYDTNSPTQSASRNALALLPVKSGLGFELEDEVLEFVEARNCVPYIFAVARVGG
jgi:iron complex outermembrane receptor protein